MNKIIDYLKSRSAGFYVGLAGALLALCTIIIYAAMNSMYFAWYVVFALALGIVAAAAAGILKINWLYIASYACYMFGFYWFLIYEIDYRMDIFVDSSQGLGAVDGIFYSAVIFFLASIIVTIVASCMDPHKKTALKEENKA